MGWFSLVGLGLIMSGFFSLLTVTPFWEEEVCSCMFNCLVRHSWLFNKWGTFQAGVFKFG